MAMKTMLRKAVRAVAFPASYLTRVVASKVNLFTVLISLIGAHHWALAQGRLPHGTSPPSEQLPQINPDGWTSSAVCGACHQAIHAVWRESMHAKAWSDGIFQAAYRRSIDAFGKERSHLCMSCHAPTVRSGQDYNVENPITSEGVTCDFCHSISAVELTDKSDPVRFAISKTKYGPLRHAQSPAHLIIHSPLHTRSEFCAACHEYRNPNGVTILGTYSEWKKSSYARKGKQCQDCHMPLIPGRVVALEVMKKTNKSVNLHNISGGHSMDRVRKAVTLELTGYEWIGDRAWVYVTVANKGSGHCFPTGLPTHRAVLTVTIHDGPTLVDQREIPFETTLLDKEHQPLRREHEIFVKAASVRSDTRLKPDEERTIEISFRNLKATRLVLSAKLYYVYSTETLVRKNGEQRIEPVEMKFLVVSRRDTMKRLGG